MLSVLFSLFCVLDHFQEKSVTCFGNVTTCSVGKIQNKYTKKVQISFFVYSQMFEIFQLKFGSSIISCVLVRKVIWGANCGVEGLKIPERYQYHCEKIELEIGLI